MSKIEELEKQIKQLKAKEIWCRFYSPGTFMSEQSSFRLFEQDIVEAVRKYELINERYDAKPYGFMFEDGNGKSTSGMYYLTGRIVKYDDIPDDKEHNILRCNMRCNNWPICIENTNSYRFTAPFKEGDCIVNLVLVKQLLIITINIK